MFRITNNNISITRGETATYDAVFKHSDGTPLTLDKNLVSDDKSVYGLFSVKLSMYDEDAVFRVPMKLDDLATFDTSADVISIGDETFSDVNVPTTVDERADKLYKRTISGVPYYYQYVGNTTIVTEDDFEEYEFRLVFPFPYNIMKSLQPKLYKYEIALVGGTPTATIADQTAITTQLPLTVDFKQYLVEYKDFKVEGSLSE